MDRHYYPRVRARVSGGTIADDILQSEHYVGMRRFIDDATAAGLDVVRSDVGFDWNIIRKEISGNPVKSVVFMHSPSSGSAALQFLLGMLIPDRPGSLRYDATQDTLSVNWPSDALTRSHSAYMDGLQRMALNGGGVALGAADVKINSSGHARGGAVMGKVCSDLGEVYGHANLFVVDGALLPGSAAMANPSLTIAANAERIMDALIPQLTGVGMGGTGALQPAG